MEPTKHKPSAETQSCKGGVMIRAFKKKRDIYLFIWVSHIVFFPFFWIWTIAFFELWVMWITLSLILTGIFSLFQTVKYDILCNGMP